VKIAQEAALRKRKNGWIDGSLRDGAWYSRAFDDLRRSHPEYRIAIFHVFVPWELVKSRATSRAEKTGRVVPEAELLASFEQVPLSIQQLAPLADFVAHIDNSDRPRLARMLAPVEGLDTGSCDWDEVSHRFAVVPGLRLRRTWSTARCFLEHLIREFRVVVFSNTYCTHCTRIKRLLAEELGPEGAHVVELDTMTLRQPPPLQSSTPHLQDGRTRELVGVEGVCGVVVHLELAHMTGEQLLPQVFIDGNFIGGCDDLLEVHSGGQLSELLLSTHSCNHV